MHRQELRGSGGPGEVPRGRGGAPLCTRAAPAQDGETQTRQVPGLER